MRGTGCSTSGHSHAGVILQQQSQTGTQRHGEGPGDQRRAPADAKVVIEAHAADDIKRLALRACPLSESLQQYGAARARPGCLSLPCCACNCSTAGTSRGRSKTDLSPACTTSSSANRQARGMHRACRIVLTTSFPPATRRTRPQACPAPAPLCRRPACPPPHRCGGGTPWAG